MARFHKDGYTMVRLPSSPLTKEMHKDVIRMERYVSKPLTTLEKRVNHDFDQTPYEYTFGVFKVSSTTLDSLSIFMEVLKVVKEWLRDLSKDAHVRKIIPDIQVHPTGAFLFVPHIVYHKTKTTAAAK